MKPPFGSHALTPMPPRYRVTDFTTNMTHTATSLEEAVSKVEPATLGGGFANIWRRGKLNVITIQQPGPARCVLGWSWHLVMGAEYEDLLNARRAS